jgi:NADP-dependent 3-hydroxy acid dehydrogenase YdfG
MAVTLKRIGEQVIVIAGATSGIGPATARRLPRFGVRKETSHPRRNTDRHE